MSTKAQKGRDVHTDKKQSRTAGGTCMAASAPQGVNGVSDPSCAPAKSDPAGPEHPPENSSRGTPSSRETPPAELAVTTPSTWHAMAASVPGRKHIRGGIPCQDAATASCEPRPLIVVADGRGSSEHSHIGSTASCRAVTETVRAATALLAQALDEQDDARAREAWEFLHDLLFGAARTRLAVVAADRGYAPSELEHTILIVVVGEQRVGYLHVGDGAIVVQDKEGLQTLSAPERGEYANATCFVGERTRPEQVRGGLIPRDGLIGIAVMTDGTADRLIHSRTHAPAPGIGTLFQQIRDRRFGCRDLPRFLTEDFWEPHVQDDRSLAVLALEKDPSETAAASPMGLAGDEAGAARESGRTHWHSHPDTAPALSTWTDTGTDSRSADRESARLKTKQAALLVAVVTLAFWGGVAMGWGLSTIAGRTRGTTSHLTQTHRGALVEPVPDEAPAAPWCSGPVNGSVMPEKGEAVVREPGTEEHRPRGESADAEAGAGRLRHQDNWRRSHRAETPGSKADVSKDDLRQEANEVGKQ